MKQMGLRNFEFLMHMYPECFRFNAIGKIISAERCIHRDNQNRSHRTTYQIYGEIEIYHYCHNYIVEYCTFPKEIVHFKRLYNQLALYKKRRDELYIHAETFVVIEDDPVPVIYDPEFTEIHFHNIFENDNGDEQ